MEKQYSKRKVRRNAGVILILFSLCVLPLIMSIPSLLQTQSPEFTFLGIDRDNSQQGFSSDFGPFENIGELSINDLIITQYEDSIGLGEKSRFIYNIFPFNPLEDEQHIPQNPYGNNLFSFKIPTVFKYEKKQGTTTRNKVLDLSTLNLIPGIYNVFVTYAKSSLLSFLYGFHRAEPQQYILKLTKDYVRLMGNPLLNKDDIAFGNVYTIENAQNSWDVHYEGYLLNSKNEPLKYKTIELFLEKQNHWVSVGKIITNEYGYFHHVEKVFGSFEVNSLAKIIFEGDVCYEPLELIEYAGLETDLGTGESLLKNILVKKCPPMLT